MEVFINAPIGYIPFEDNLNLGNYYCITTKEHERIRDIEAYPYGEDALADSSVLIEAYKLEKEDSFEERYSMKSESKRLNFPLNRYKVIVLKSYFNHTLFHPNRHHNFGSAFFLNE